MDGRIDIIGLGPADVEWMLPTAVQYWEDADIRLLRTTRHPAAQSLIRTAEAADQTWESFDARYELESEIEAVYQGIADRVLESAATGATVVYAVPGSPIVAERAVELIREAADARGVQVVVHPGIGVDAIAAARIGTIGNVADGQETDSLYGKSGPTLITQVDTPFVLSDVKLSLLDSGCDPSLPVTVLRHLGTLQESITKVPLVDIDRLPTDHLTSLWVDLPDTRNHSQGAEVAIRELLALGAVLRGPGGCPWDAKQTHHSLRKYVLEEAYEVVDIIDQLPTDAPNVAAVELPEAYERLVDELGDLLYQVVFHSLLAEEVAAFSFADVANAIHDKLVRRHPQVLHPGEDPDVAAVEQTWEAIKQEERKGNSAIDSIPKAMPPLMFANKLLGKAKGLGVPEPTRDSARAELIRSIQTLEISPTPEDGSTAQEQIGAIVGALLIYARSVGVDLDTAVREWATRLATDLRSREHGQL